MPATDLKIGTFVLIPNFNTQKGISKKLQPLRKGPYKIIAKPTEVTYKLPKRIRFTQINPIIFFHLFRNCSKQYTNGTRNKRK